MHGIQFIHFLYGLFRWSITQWRHQVPSIFFWVVENIAPTLGLTRATEGKWMGCLQTAINWAWLVCHHLPISCGLLSLPEMEDVGRWREVSKRCLRQYAKNWTELTCDLDIAHHLDQYTSQARQNTCTRRKWWQNTERTSMKPVQAQACSYLFLNYRSPLHECSIFCRNVLLDCISFSLVNQINWKLRLTSP